jgi:multidrug resistance efflux pump
MMIRYGLPAVAALILTFATVSIVRTRPIHATSRPPSAPPTGAFAKNIGAVGVVEASSGNVSVSPAVPGLVTRVYVQAGDQVNRGAKLFTIDDRDLQAELTLRRSALALAEAKLAKLLAPPRPAELAPAAAKVAEAIALEKDARVQLELIEAVRDKRAIREEDLFRRRIALETAAARRAEAEAELALRKAGASQPDIDIARAQEREAQRQVECAQAYIERVTVTAPISGQVLQLRIHAGEYAATGQLAQPLLLLGVTDHLNVRAEVDEQEAWRVKAGSRAVGSVRGDGSRRYPLRFVRLEPYVSAKRNLTGDGAERVDTRVLQVIFELDRGAAVYAGQQMDVFLDAGGGR